MKKQIVINASKDRSRIAIVENDELVELYVENPDNVRTIGNVYLGQIQKVMPAIRAAFVDVGQKQDCFLHFSDLTDNLPQLLALAGEDVPGLNEPVLSLAPAKRVADDDDEPDVEDALEVEVAEPESSTKSRSRRRSRGRGRSRRGRGRGRSEEEEEQEEQGRRRLPGVIDLSSPARRPTRRRAPEPEEEDEDVTDETAPAAEAEETPTAQVEETPADDAPAKPSSRRRSTKAETSEEADASESAGDTREADEDDAADEAAVPKKRRRRRRGGKGRDSDASDNETDEDASDSTPEADAPDAEEAPKPKRSRRKKADAPAEPEPAAETPEADAAADDEAEEAPKPKRSRRKKDAPSAEAEEQQEDDGPRPGDVSPTGRSRRPANPATADADETDGEVTDEEDESSSSSKRLPSTLDLTSSATKPSRSRRSPQPSDDDSDEETESSGRSRRSRGGRPAEAKTDDTESKDSSEASDDTSSRSRRGRSRSSSDDSKGDDTTGRSRRGGRSSDDASDETDAAESESGNRRRSRGGRSSSSDDASASDTSKGEDTSGGGRRGRSSSDRSSSDRTSGQGSGRSSGRSSDRSSGHSNGAQKNGPIPPNEELLRRSGKIIVKITKEAISTKGPRVSTDLSLAGRFLVLVPAADYVAVSKKIESAKERRRLRTLATSLKPDRFGVIVRTVAEGRDAKSLDTDLRLLVDKWRKIEQKLNENPEPPVLLYQDVNMVSSVIRDLFSEDYDRILVDDPKVFKNVQAYVRAVAPQMADKVELHAGRAPVFRSLGIEKQVEEAFSKRVNMRGGGYLYIETTEAMHVVDVNSGRAGRGKSQKQNLIDVNVEAAREVAKQLRLRDLGGIIVVDFIDLKYDRDRKKVTDVLKEAFAKDRAVTKLLPMSDFGLVQITRQRLRPSITANATDEDGNLLDAADAVEAAGAGEIRRQGQQAYVEPEPQPQSTEPVAERPALSPEDASPRALSGRLRGWLDHYRQTVDEKYKRRPIVVRVHPLFGGYLRGGFPSLLMRWRLSLRGITFVLEEDATVDPLTFDVRDQKSGRTLLKKYSV